MVRVRSLVGGRVLALALLLVGAEARAITLPDTSSPCSTGSSDGCLKITNTDSTDYGSPAINAVSQSPMGAGIQATGGYGIQATGSYSGGSFSSGNIGLEADGTNVGVSASGGYYGVQASTSNPLGIGVSANNSGGGAAIQATTTGLFGLTGGTAIQAVSNEIGGTGIGITAYHGISVTGAQYGISVQAAVTAFSCTGGVYGVYGSGTQYGLSGMASSSAGVGVIATNSNTSGGMALKAVADQYTGTGADISGNLGVNVNGSLEGMQIHGGYTGIAASGGWYGVQASGTSMGVSGSSSGAGYAVYGSNTDPSGYAGYFDGRVYSTVSFTSSDARLKKDIAGLGYGLKDVAALHPVTYRWKDLARGDGRYIGFLAQDLQKIIPEVVDQNAKTGLLSVNYSGLVPVLVKAVQEQQVAIQEQQALIQRQSARLDQLEERPIVSSMFSGGINLTVALGALAALGLSVIRRRRERSDS